MAKKHKKKFKLHHGSGSHHSDSVVSTAEVIAEQSETIRKEDKAVLNKEMTIAHTLAPEYRVIKKDLAKVLFVNLVFLAGVLTLYYTNKSSGYLVNWLSSVVKF